MSTIVKPKTESAPNSDLITTPNPTLSTAGKNIASVFEKSSMYSLSELTKGL